MDEGLQTVHMSDGCAIRAKIIGDEPGKPLMIAHHGAPGIGTYLEPEIQYSDLADIFRILVFDARGCGGSEKKQPFTHEQWVKDVDELRQWTGVDKFFMIGASHGGILTLEYALAHPDRLYGIIVGDSTPQLAHWGVANATKIALTDPRTKGIDPDQFFRLMVGELQNHDDAVAAMAACGPLYAAPDHVLAQAETDVAEVIGRISVIQWETLNASHNYCLSRYDVRDRLHTIPVPAFVYVGKYDWICPVRMSEEIAAGIPNSNFRLYERSGHFAALEEKKAWTKDVRAFLADLGFK